MKLYLEKVSSLKTLVVSVGQRRRDGDGARLEGDSCDAIG